MVKYDEIKFLKENYKMKITKIISLFWALVMVLSLFAACAETGDEAETTEAIAGTEAPATEPEVTKDPNYDDDGYLKSKLPEDVKYTGEKISILCWASSSTVTPGFTP